MSQKLWQGITPADLEILKKVSIALERKNYDEALSHAREMKSLSKQKTEADRNNLGEALIDVVLWNKYSDQIQPKHIAFSDISTFVIDNPFYPNIAEIKRNVELVAVANNVPYEVSQFYFNNNPANNIDAKVYMVDAKIEALSREKIDEKRNMDQLLKG